MTPRPHDALFRSAFEVPSAAAALVRELVSAEVRDSISWESLRGESGAYVDPALVDSYSDLLFSARLIDGDLPIYLLLEHQSTEDPTMPLRVAAYQIRIWERWIKEHERARLPPILSVVVSHATRGWMKARSFQEMFEPRVMNDPVLTRLVPRYSLSIEELAHRSDDALRAWSLPAFQKLTLWVLRDARDSARLLASFDTWVPTMLQLLRSPPSTYMFETLVHYMSQVIGPMFWDDLHARIRRMITPSPNLPAPAEALDEDTLGAPSPAAILAVVQALDRAAYEKGRVAAMRSQLMYKFKLASLDAVLEERLREATPEAIDRYLQRVLVADSLAAVFDD